MLSPGTWHKRIPREWAANLRKRNEILEACKGSKANQRAMVQMCQEDVLAYINLFVWQYNPLKKGLLGRGPFLTWPFQEEALVGRPETTGTQGILWCYEHNRSAVVEKSRDMGASWLFLILQDWLCLFHPYVETLDISRSAEAVDSPSRKSLFAKLRFMHDHLPRWLTGGITEQKMYFHFERTKSEITGEASTGRAGVGGRAGVIFIDEFAKIKEATAVRERTANTSDCRFFNSTHEGTETEFAKLCQTPEIVKIQMHWTQHPEKGKGRYRYDAATNRVEILDPAWPPPLDYPFVLSEAPLGGPYPGVRSPWYDAKCVEIGSPRGVAIELDIDVGGSVSQFFSPQELRELKAAYGCPPYWEGHLSYDREAGRPLGLTRLPDGPLKLWLHPGAEGQIPAGLYAAGADVSTGEGATNSCVSLANASTGEKVLEFATASMRPADFASLVLALCWLMKDEGGVPAKLAWETPGPGVTFGERVLELGFRHIHWREGHVTLAGGKLSQIPGWYCSNETKRALLEEYREALGKRQFVNRSERALAECIPYHYTPRGTVEHPHDRGLSTDPTGARQNHGDRVIADALCWKMVKSLGIMGRNRKEETPTEPAGSFAWRRQLRAERSVGQDVWND